jgi:hypothetical protein
LLEEDGAPGIELHQHRHEGDQGREQDQRRPRYQNVHDASRHIGENALGGAARFRGHARRHAISGDFTMQRVARGRELLRARST